MDAFLHVHPFNVMFHVHPFNVMFKVFCARVFVCLHFQPTVAHGGIPVQAFVRICEKVEASDGRSYYPSRGIPEVSGREVSKSFEA